MSVRSVSDSWGLGSPYEQYIGRWSRQIAPLFLSWLDVPTGRRWVDVGCGTGALSAAILDQCSPASLVGVDPSEGFLELASRHLGAGARFLAGRAEQLPLEAGACDVAVSGLVLNFVPDPGAALAEAARVVGAGGTVGAYVWDYADQMEIIRLFWDAAVSLDPAAEPLHEGRRFPLCRPGPLRSLFEDAGYAGIETRTLDLRAHFKSFEDYWEPFLGGQGPAPAYAMSLEEGQRNALRENLRAALAPTSGEGLALSARALAIRGRVPT